jgi:hypothetical protein
MNEKDALTAGFTVGVDNNPHRLPSDRELHVVITVSAHSVTGKAPAATAPEVAEVIIFDTSGSMHHPYDKLPAAKRATQAAVGALRDGAHFAVVAGTDKAQMVYPAGHSLAVASASTKRAAVLAVRDIQANGGTAIGRWLTLAGQLLMTRPDAIRHALLFTDGQNGESRGDLDRVLDRWAGRFSCDARGIGTDYVATEVIRIVSALDGLADAVRSFSDLEAEMRAIMDTAMRKQVASVALQIRPMAGSSLRFLKQTYPARVDLTERLGAPDALGGRELDTGAWGDERREYHLCLDLEPPPRISGRPSVAARVTIAAPEPVAQGKVMVHWTEDASRSLPMDPSVARALDQAEMGRAIDAGCAALRRGDEAAAEQHLGRAVLMAEQSGDPESTRRLERLVTIEDAARGKVRVRSGAEEVDLLETEMWSVRSSMTSMTDTGEDDPEIVLDDLVLRTSVPETDPPDVVDLRDGPDPVCEACGFVGRTGDLGCERCGAPMVVA